MRAMDVWSYGAERKRSARRQERLLILLCITVPIVSFAALGGVLLWKTYSMIPGECQNKWDMWNFPRLFVGSSDPVIFRGGEPVYCEWADSAEFIQLRDPNYAKARSNVLKERYSKNPTPTLPD